MQAIIGFLKKQYGYELSDAPFKRIDKWRQWWEGLDKTFHVVHDILQDGSRKSRELYRLKMAKKVSEDWAAILLNEKTTLTISDAASSGFVQGSESDQGTGGILGNNGFWQAANELIEKSFAMGTGAFLIKLNGLRQTGGGTVIKDRSTQIRIEYMTAAQCIPLTVQCGKVTEAAFFSEEIVKGKKYVYLETHRLVEGKYTIDNFYFLNENGLKEQPLPEGVAENMNTGSDVPLFVIFSPNIAPAHGVDGYGESVYEQGIDALKACDLAFNNFCRDFSLGGKKVFLSDKIIKFDIEGNPIAPDDVMQQLFEVVDIETNKQGLIQEHNPDLRVEANSAGIQQALDLLSFKVGFGTKHYQFNAGDGGVVTATQYHGDKQELVQNAAKHYIAIEQALQNLIRAILWCGREILGEPVNPEASVTVNFEDGYIIDKESERERDRQDIRDGLMQKWEYRVKWRGEDEETAKRMTAENTDDTFDFKEGEE